MKFRISWDNISRGFLIRRQQLNFSRAFEDSVSKKKKLRPLGSRRSARTSPRHGRLPPDLKLSVIRAQDRRLYLPSIIELSTRK